MAMSMVTVGNEPTLGLDVPWALVGVPRSCGIQQDALETRLGSKGESYRVCDPSIWVHGDMSWNTERTASRQPYC